MLKSTGPPNALASGSMLMPAAMRPLVTRKARRVEYVSASPMTISPTRDGCTARPHYDSEAQNGSGLPDYSLNVKHAQLRAMIAGCGGTLETWAGSTVTVPNCRNAHRMQRP